MNERGIPKTNQNKDFERTLHHRRSAGFPSQWDGQKNDMLSSVHVQIDRV